MVFSECPDPLNRFTVVLLSQNSLLLLYCCFTVVLLLRQIYSRYKHRTSLIQMIHRYSSESSGTVITERIVDIAIILFA